MKTPIQSLPPAAEMYQALCDRDSHYEGLFFVGVRTTGIFCRPTCPARKPRRENVDFFASARDALAAGFRACKRCRPLHVSGATPDWLGELLDRVDADPNRRWTDNDIRQLQIEPARVRRWFKSHHCMTFHSYLRARRLGNALSQIRTGDADTTGAALDNGYESLSGFRDAFKKWFGQSPRVTKSAVTDVKLNRILTPLGPMIVGATEEWVCLLEFADRRMLETQLKRVQKIYSAVFSPGTNALMEQTESQLLEYFAGHRRKFNLPVDTTGSQFQMQVWNCLNTIPYGRTASYEKIASEIGRAGASRAVGRANGDNRLAIIIPCHRVIRSDGSISGYGGGVWRKKWLLAHERSCAV